MADILDYTEITVPTGDDAIYLVDDADGTPIDGYCTLTNFQTFIVANIHTPLIAEGEMTTPVGADIIMVIDDPAGTPATEKLTITNLFANAQNIGIGAGGSPVAGLHLVGSTTLSKIRQTYSAGRTYDLHPYILGISNNGWEIYDVTGSATRIAIAAGGDVGIGKAPSSKLDIDLATEDLEIVDAGSASATEQDWIQVEVGGIVGYIRVFAAK